MQTMRYRTSDGGEGDDKITRVGRAYSQAGYLAAVQL